MQQETNSVAKANTREHKAPRPGPADYFRPKEYWKLRDQPDNIRAPASEAQTALGSRFVDVVRMYNTANPVEYKMECPHCDPTLANWYQIRFRLRTFILSIHHLLMRDNYLTTFKTGEDVCVFFLKKKLQLVRDTRRVHTGSSRRGHMVSCMCVDGLFWTYQKRR